jgi:hypothetical protein
VIEALFYMLVIFLAMNWKLLLLAAALIGLAHALLRNSKAKDERLKVSTPRIAGLVGIAFVIFFGVWFVYVMWATKGAPFGH